MSDSERTLTIRVRRRDGGAQLELELDAPPDRHVSDGLFSSPARASDLDDLSWLIEDYPRLLGQASLGIADRIERRLADLGHELGESVFGRDQRAAPIRAALADPCQLEDLHVRVESDGGGGWVPWELLTVPDSDRPLSLRAASFVRAALGTARSSRPGSADGTILRILIVVARPSDDDVAFRSVASRIVRAAALPGSQLQITILRPPTFAALETALATASAGGEPFDAVHFDGHGVYREPAFTTGGKRGYLRFESADGGPDEVRGSVVGRLLAEHGVRLLLLNACRSAFAGGTGEDGSQSLDDPALGSVASDAFAAGLCGVLAMGFDVYVATAARLIASVYAALGAGRSLGEAVAHARRAEADRGRTSAASGCEWLVPVVYEAEPMRLARWAEQVPELGAATNTATPQPGAVAGGSAADGQRFFGYDDIMLRLDRAIRDSPVVELVGVAGIGKTAVAAEFARWSVATGAARTALVLDAADYPSADALRTALAERMSAADGPALVIVDHADRAGLSGDISQPAACGRVLLTGRAPSGLAGVTTIVLDGLDAEASQELAREHGWDPTGPGAAAVLEWAQGVPALILGLPTLVAAVAPTSVDETDALLWSLRDGWLDSELERQRLLDEAGLEVFDVDRLTDPTLPIALMLFHGYLAVPDWEMFCQLMAAQGWDLGQDNPARTLAEQLRLGVAAGLACQHGDHGFRLHPLAPMTLQSSFETIVNGSVRGDRDRFALVRLRLWAVYVQAVRLTQATLGLPPQVPGRLRSRSRELGLASRAQLENLTFAAQLGVRRAWWGIALPIVRRLRDELLAEQREDEWLALLNRIETGYASSPPTERETGPENVPLLMTKLRADEAERVGDLAGAARLREQALAQAFDREVTVTVEPTDQEDGSDDSVDEQGGDAGRRAEPDGARGYDITVGPRFSALIKQADLLARQQSADCLQFYLAAGRLAVEAGDHLRLPEAELATAHAFLNVRTLYDPEQYEGWARLALATAEEFAAFDADLFARCKLSVGLAILERTTVGVELTPDRAAEARGCLLLAATAEGAGPPTRAAARNGLGNLLRVSDDWAAAASEYLRASAEFEALSDWDAVAAAQTNAAIALGVIGRMADAVGVARQALLTLEKAPSRVDELRPRLAAVLRSADEEPDLDPESLIAILTAFLVADPDVKRALLADSPELLAAASLNLLRDFARVNREQGREDVAEDIEKHLRLLVRVIEIGADRALAEYTRG